MRSEKGHNDLKLQEIEPEDLEKISPADYDSNRIFCIDLDKFDKCEGGFEEVLAFVRRVYERPTQYPRMVVPCIIIAATPKAAQTAPDAAGSEWLTSSIPDYEERRAAVLQAGCIFCEKSPSQEDGFVPELESRIRDLYSQFEGGERGEFVKRDHEEDHHPIGIDNLGAEWDPVDGARYSEIQDEPSQEEDCADRSGYARPPFAISRGEYEHLWSRIQMPDDNWRKDE